MKNIKVLHFIYGDLAFNNFLYPLIKSNKSKLFSQEVIIGGKEIDLSVFKTKKGKGLHFGYNFELRNPIISFLKIMRLISRKSPTTIVAHMTLYALYPLLIAKLLKIENRIYICHGLSFLGYKGLVRFILKVIDKFNIALSTKTICVTPSICKEAKKINKKRNIVTIYPGSSAGLSLDKYITKKELNEKFKNKKKRNQLKVLYVGRGTKRKGIHELLDAAKSKIILEKNIMIDIVGFSSNQLKINKKKLPNNVTFHGFQNDVRPYYKDSDIVILPSWHDGFGYTLLEGAAYGCAMIASDIPGPTSLVTDNFNGSLISPRSTKEIESSILKYYNDDSMLINHMQNAYSTSLKYEEEKILTQMSDFILDTYSKK